jgi:hypothetical protein
MEGVIRMEQGAVGMPLFGHAVDAALRGIRNEVALGDTS